MRIEHGIDWISVTSKPDTVSKRNPRLVLPYLLDEHVTETKARNGYTVARKYTLTGAVEMSNPQRPDMGVHTIYTGSVLRNLYKYGQIAPADVLRWHMGQGHMLSRLDVCIDVHDSGLNIRDLFSERATGTVETQAKSMSLIQTENASGYAGDTLYVGSLKKRKKLLRVYDKAAELGEMLDGVLADHKRIEFEVHGKPATTLGRELCDMKWMSQTVISSAIKGYANFANPTWRGIFESVEAWKIGSQSAAEMAESDTRKWLLDQCAPALAKQIAADPAFMSIFFERVTYELNKSGEVKNE